ncbi:phage tail terminator family protein [Heyndrickxia sp. NPDC080065]|uniref:phage tail terminator family protein n=1 Tax=Heyndrickxia sp. NPDC080065 TaxID=3390568 RepID=UPI003CFC2C96
MNQEVGSIMNFFYNVFPCKIYTKEVPENFAVPSMYFPAPFSFDGNDTTSTFKKTYSLSVKLFHKDSQQADDEAEKIADVVREKRSIIPILNDDGSNIGSYLRLSRIETRIADRGVAIIQVTWDSRYFYEREEYKGLENFKIASGVKESGKE